MKLVLLICAIALNLTPILGQIGDNEKLFAVLEALDIGAKRTLADLNPELKSAIDSSNITDDCYNSQIGPNEHVDIFRDDVQSVVTKYFMRHELLNHLNANKTRHRVKALIDSVRRIALLVLHCQTKKPHNRTRWGLTSMSAYTVEEFRSTFSSGISRTLLQQSEQAINKDPRCSLKPLDGETPLPDRFNWLENGVNLTVYNQSYSKWCSIFSSVSAIEAAVQINKRGQQDMYDYGFSQMAIGACNTGSIYKGMYVESVMEYAIAYGLTNYNDAPFSTIPETTPCKNFPTNENIKVKDYCARVHFNYYLEEDDLRRLTYRNGPSVVLIGTDDNFQGFSGTIFNEYCPSDYNHAVLLLGWDEKHWILQNSYGHSWGNEGRFKLPRGENKCGVQTLVASALM